MPTDAVQTITTPLKVGGGGGGSGGFFGVWRAAHANIYTGTVHVRRRHVARSLICSAVARQETSRAF
jgi:hypothetical protein